MTARKPTKKPAPSTKKATTRAAATKSAGKRAPAKKAPGTKPTPTRSVGRPSSFREEYIGQAKKLAALGATDLELADFFGVSTVTLFNWRTSVPEFLNATRLGKDAADERVESRLFARAMGYEHDEVDIRVVNGKLVKTPIRKFYPPDTAAASLWLRNRKPERWRDKVETAHMGPDGGPVQVHSTVTFVRAPLRNDEDDA